MKKVKPVSVDTEGLEAMTRPMLSVPSDDLDMKVLQARNLAAVRKREAEETAPKKRSVGASPTARPAAPRAAAPMARKNTPAPTTNTAAATVRENTPAAAAPKPAAAAPKPAAATRGRVGTENFGPKLDKIIGAFSRFSDSAKQGDAAAKKSIAAGQADRMKAVMRDAAADKKAIAAGQAARMAEKAASVAKSKKDYDPYSKSSNLKMALAQFGFKKGGSVASKRADGCAVRGKTKGKMV